MFLGPSSCQTGLLEENWEEGGHSVHTLVSTKVGVPANMPSGPIAAAAAYRAYCGKDIPTLVPKLLVLQQPSFHPHKNCEAFFCWFQLPAGTSMVDTGCRSADGGRSLHQALQ